MIIQPDAIYDNVEAVLSAFILHSENNNLQASITNVIDEITTFPLVPSTIQVTSITDEIITSINANLITNLSITNVIDEITTFVNLTAVTNLSITNVIDEITTFPLVPSTIQVISITDEIITSINANLITELSITNVIDEILTSSSIQGINTLISIIDEPQTSIHATLTSLISIHNTIDEVSTNTLITSSVNINSNIDNILTNIQLTIPLSLIIGNTIETIKTFLVDTGTITCSVNNNINIFDQFVICHNEALIDRLTYWDKSRLVFMKQSFYDSEFENGFYGEFYFRNGFQNDPKIGKREYVYIKKDIKVVIVQSVDFSFRTIEQAGKFEIGDLIIITRDKLQNIDDLEYIYLLANFYEIIDISNYFEGIQLHIRQTNKKEYKKIKTINKFEKIKIETTFTLGDV